MGSIFIVVFALAGGIGLRTGLRGRRIDDHPLCAGCGFDLTGRPEDSSRCAECGADLRGPMAVRIGHRRRRVGWVVGGVALLLVAIVGGALDVVEQTQSFNWINHAPVKWLLYAGQNGSAASRSDALKELVDRARKSVLGPRQISATVAVALTMQGDASKAWDAAWGDIIELERANNGVSDEQWRQYAHQALRDALGFRVRSAVRLGDPLPYAIEAKKGRTATRTALRLLLSSTSLRFDASSDDSTGGVSFGPDGFVDGCSIGSEVNAGRAFEGLSPGEHVLHFHGKVIVGEPQGTDDVSHLVSEEIDLNGPVNLVPATQPTVRAVANPSLANAIRNGMRATLRVNLKQPSSSESEIMVNNAPVGLSFKVYGVIAGKEFEIGSFACRAGTQNSGWDFSPCHPLIELVSQVQATTNAAAATPRMTIVLRSDPQPAIHSTDVTDYWEGTIEMKDVPVQQ